LTIKIMGYKTKKFRRVEGVFLDRVLVDVF